MGKKTIFELEIRNISNKDYVMPIVKKFLEDQKFYWDAQLNIYICEIKNGFKGFESYYSSYDKIIIKACILGKNKKKFNSILPKKISLFKKNDFYEDITDNLLQKLEEISVKLLETRDEQVNN